MFYKFEQWFFYYDRILVKEGIDIETYEHHDGFINESLSKRCNSCHVLPYNKNNFNYNKRTCNRCSKILLNTEFEPRDVSFSGIIENIGF